jgi:plastocyanin
MRKRRGRSDRRHLSADMPQDFWLRSLAWIPMLKTIARAAAAASLIALPLAACGGGDSAGSGSASADLTVHGLDAFKFDKADYSVHGGELTIALVNDGGQQHSLVIEGKDFKVLTNGHQTKSGKVTLEPGTYTIFCDITGHRQAGMEAKLEVTAAPSGGGSSSTGN